MGRFYVYLHRKATDGTVFYVGKGRARRAWDSHNGRNYLWRRVANSHGFSVEIFQDNMTEKAALDLESELIKKHGRLIVKTGCLTNLSTGGESGSTGLKPINYIWTKEKCFKNAQQYRSRKTWRVEDNGAYNSARKNEWLEECCEHMTEMRGKFRVIHTLVSCRENALKYKGRKEWRNAAAGAYSAALKNGWLAECCGHMISKKGQLNRKKVLCIDTGEIYSSLTDAGMITGAQISSISQAIKGKRKSAGGYRWSYA